MAQPRVIVVGAGPAGTRCAETLVAAGLRPVVIDEGRRDGGQIYRRQPEGFTRPYRALYGTEAGRAAAVHETFDRLKEKIDYRPETLVWNIAGDEVHTVSGTTARSLAFDALILCTGATDRLMPVKGWHLAGAYSLGGAQVALKSQACSIGHRVVFLGSGPLLYLVASQYLKAGATVAAVLDTSPFSLRVGALPKLAAQPGVLWNGLMLALALKRAGVAVHTGVTPLEIEGTPEDGVTGVVFQDIRGRRHQVACDAAALGYHLRPETQLADLARCGFAFDERTRQWLPIRDEDGRSSVPGVYLAGDGAHILGARAAEDAGRLAALAALKDTGLPVDAGELARLRQGMAGYARFAQGLAEAFPWPAEQAARLPDDAIVCRCEAISAGELRRVVRDMDAREANRAKAFSRVGMGRCQGRYCGHAGAEVIAAAAGVPVREVGRLRGQAPVKPLPAAIEEETP
ncbi:FAD/NAD(P)-binding oxidoreductase [Nitrospirillum sp. BR 11163]|uniref:FAD/NAD(P)-dependent oxidoreductase n=1 Tax=Nitrospirillum sp. BR 11163 TaxID=3104323 RepID=UPI002B0037CD|nr:FAD/NAD(P)-binding oxidoreductase [Nitrospirillum sp. BR 11163]MEA1671994.1 FAD/NAD(P)-binding oxidoreductase [Nitrospirillum sp. BR 11163]